MNLFFRIFFLCVLFSTGICRNAQGQNTINGHLGFVQPIVTIQNGDVSTGFDPYTIGFPMGITVRKSETFAFDVELVPFINSSKDSEGKSISAVNELIIHPGLLWGLGNQFTFGNRLAFELQSKRYGITPLLNKGFKLGKTNVFAELVLPIRVGSGQSISVTAALHFGVGF